ncbi:hypothetical protein D3OALGA1CA_5253 [Olavius algarvensis associated proteobacterium Delta 3]|nr:hypothetical protein D3OALGB2SA_546 [Olavius algarvensis associated proteobacterium Delta 3]CAB5164076.1 hypothetical protein D3OALGA1CA_5253 [Olavius algarvensis associated proteobacterium Delta 3]
MTSLASHSCSDVLSDNMKPNLRILKEVFKHDPGGYAR